VYHTLWATSALDNALFAIKMRHMLLLCVRLQGCRELRRCHRHAPAGQGLLQHIDANKETCIPLCI
jgi:hypothetical protein